MMDESYLTGEPYQIAKVTGSAVLSGATNGETALTIRVGQLPVDSRYQKIVRVMEKAEIDRPRFRRIADRLGAWYTVLALAVAAAVWIAGRNPARFLAVLVIATQCPLLLAIPVAIIGAISVAAARAIIIKDPATLERVDSCRTIIFDKTGTLTYGKPILTEVLCARGVDRLEAVRMAASLEQYSKHPLAAAILEAARHDQVSLAEVAEISEARRRINRQGRPDPPSDHRPEESDGKDSLPRILLAACCSRDGGYFADRRRIRGYFSAPRCSAPREPALCPSSGPQTRCESCDDSLRRSGVRGSLSGE